MRKKYLLACLVIAVLLLTAELLWYGYAPKIAKSPKEISKSQLSDAYLSSLSFANEPLPVADALVIYRIKRMLTTYRHKNLQTYRLHRQATRLFPIMEPILAKYGIPSDFKYVPLVESGLSSGTSAKGASGLWQFMPETARSFGLKVNSSVDERHQVEKSTIAACRYLKMMYKDLHNWTLVAAAYNIGDNKLKRLIGKQNQANYFRMKLNRETATYVYKLVAMKEIIEHPGYYGYRKASSPKVVINVDNKRYYPVNLMGGFIATKSQVD